MKLFGSRCEQIAAIVRKDFLLGLRRRVTFAAMMMFALTTVASLSLSTSGAIVEENFLAALLWTQAGTLPTLKLYAHPQALLFGKMIYVLLSLAALTIFILPIFLILFDVAVENFLLLLMTILLGLIGLAAAGTLTAALMTSATIKGGLFSILLFPITLPIFLPAIQLTEVSFTSTIFEANSLVVIAAFDLILITATSILYDYL